MFAALLFQTSLLVQPLYLDDAPPPLRTARDIVVMIGATGDRDETLRTASDVVARLRAGADFGALAQQFSSGDSASHGEILGTFAPGMLAPELDRFLFGAELQQISEPLPIDRGFAILQRVDTYAAVRQILVRGQDEAARGRALALLEKLRAGGDFAELARAHSEDEDSARRGGQFAIYERGPKDVMLKAAAFHLQIGELAGPIATPLGWHVIQRVAESEIDPKLRENPFVRLRGILIRFDMAGGDLLKDRNQGQAKEIADKVYARLAAGEDMGALAAEFDEDAGGRERRGDLGWIYRNSPTLPAPLRQAALMAVGGTTKPGSSSLGYLILRRER